MNKAKQRFYKKNPNDKICATVNFSVWKYESDPLLSVVDYLLWTVERIFEKGEVRSYNYINPKIVKIIDLYDPCGVQTYTPENPLTDKNKISLQP